jgi:dihydrofolate reductase
MKVTLRPSVTIDGYIADKNGECYSWINPNDEARYDAALKSCGCELVGRKTYEQYQEDFNARTDITTFIYTSQTHFIDTDKLKFVHGDPRKVLEEIKGYGFTEVIVSGGGELNGLLASKGLIDELHLSIHPIALNSGIKLFGSYENKITLQYESSNTDIPGIIQAKYKVLGGL